MRRTYQKPHVKNKARLYPDRAIVFDGDRHEEDMSARNEACNTRMTEDYAESRAAAILE